MIAAMSLMVIFVISFAIVRVAAVAMRLTGMSDGQARFQALSALTGTGFTTSEAEMIVNYPIRRKIVSSLMIIGNLGLVSFVSTLMISFMRTDAHLPSIAAQIGWIAGGVGILYLIMMHKAVDRVLCGMIASLLKNHSQLGRRRFTRLLQIGDGFSVVEHRVAIDEAQSLESFLEGHPDLHVLAVRQKTGTVITGSLDEHICTQGDSIILHGPDDQHEALGHEHAEPPVESTQEDTTK